MDTNTATEGLSRVAAKLAMKILGFFFLPDISASGLGFYAEVRHHVGLS